MDAVKGDQINGTCEMSCDQMAMGFPVIFAVFLIAKLFW
jgi:hypothetical protein